MLMKRLGTVVVTLAILAAGVLKRERMKNEVRILRDYELSMEQLRESICYEKLMLRQALCKAAEGKCVVVQRYLQSVAEDFSFHAEDALLKAHLLPVAALTAAGQAQERLLQAFTEEIRRDRLLREEKLEERCRSCMSVAVALSAICAIVML